MTMSRLSNFGAAGLKNEAFPTLMRDGSVIDMTRPSKVGRHFREQNPASSSLPRKSAEGSG